MTTEYHGPFQRIYYKITIDGFKVPYITATKLQNGSWSLLLDERFEIEVSEAEIDRWMWWIANAMAISAGYSSFGENGIPYNNFKTKLVGLSDFDAEDLGIDV